MVNDGRATALRAPTLAEIKLAAESIKSKAIRTPLVRLNWQGLPCVEIYLKLENLQPIASFKVRPAVNALARISDKAELRRVGVCTASAGILARA